MYKLNYSGIFNAEIQRSSRLGLGKIRMGESFPPNSHTAIAENKRCISLSGAPEN